MLPPPDDLSDNALLQIVQSEMSDVEVNELVWKYLGYRRGDDGGWSVEGGGWNGDGVFPNWAKNHPVAARAGYDVPTPPDLVGVTRTYAREVDEPILRAVQALQRSVPRDHKDRLRPTLRPLGWSGYKLDGLTPNTTRARRWRRGCCTTAPSCTACRSTSCGGGGGARRGGGGGAREAGADGHGGQRSFERERQSGASRTLGDKQGGCVEMRRSPSPPSLRSSRLFRRRHGSFSVVSRSAYVRQPIGGLYNEPRGVHSLRDPGQKTVGWLVCCIHPTSVARNRYLYRPQRQPGPRDAASACAVHLPSVS